MTHKNEDACTEGVSLGSHDQGVCENEMGLAGQLEEAMGCSECRCELCDGAW